jgi:hypothetical protein
MNEIDRIILTRCYDRPCWARSFASVKPRLTILCAGGLLERCPPPGGKGRNMVRLSDHGISVLERMWERDKRRQRAAA